jgi:hypothetical protein
MQIKRRKYPVILSEAKDPAQAGTTTKAARHSPEACDIVRTPRNITNATRPKGSFDSVNAPLRSTCTPLRMTLCNRRG